MNERPVEPRCWNAAINPRWATCIQDDSDGTVDNVFRFDFHRLLGDYDGDTDVDINDRNLFFAAYESHQGDLAYDVIYDLNVNGMVDRDDYRIWRSQYRKSL